jgi:hypothetical protein
MPLAAILTPSAANAAAAAPGCSGYISIDQMSFTPPSIPAGGTSALTVVAQNCTSQVLEGRTTWSGQYTWPGGGIPPGCPAIDPISLPFTYGAGALETITEEEGDPIAGCLATGLQVTVTFTVNNVGEVAEATADLTIVQSAPPLACHVTYAPDVFAGGFAASVAISNTGAASFNGWTLTFTFPGDEHITEAWNATVTQTDASVSAVNLSYNATISPGGSQSFGFQGTWTFSDASPTAFSVNGVACA